MKASIGIKHLFPISLLKRRKFNSFSAVLLSKLYELNAMTRGFLTKIKGMIQKLNSSSNMMSLCTPRQLERWWLNTSILPLSQPRHCSKVSTRLEALKMFYVGEITWKLLGTRNDTTRRLLSIVVVHLVVHGLSWVDGVGIILRGWLQWVFILDKIQYLLPFTWRCCAFEGLRLPSKWTHFS